VAIFVDADGCPVVEDVIEIADDVVEEPTVHVIHNRHHNLEADRPFVRVIETGDRPDEADHYIYNNVEPDDLVVTDDLGLAALVLKRGALVLRFRGDTLDDEDVEHRLAMRHVSAKARRDDRHQGGPPAFSDEDRNRFRHVFRSILEDDTT
jgi:uncharacterized protein YaiI (UPF0178 family)